MEKTSVANSDRDGELYADYWWVQTPWECHLVSGQMASVIRAEIQRRFPRTWISVVDLAGGRLFLRTRTIVALGQSSRETRELWKRFRAERNQDNSEASFGD